MPSRKNQTGVGPDLALRTADLLAEELEAVGVRHVFGMPGSHSTTIYDAIVRRDSPRTILIRNEQAGAFAADGYARVTGRPGVICTTAGPGATNAITGVSEAWADSVPLLLLTGQVNADRMHQECGAYHEIDLHGLLRPITKSCEIVTRPASMRSCLQAAWNAMTTGRPRPAALILPQDVMKARVESDPESGGESTAEEVAPPDGTSVHRAAELLRQATRPVIVAGGGALWADAGKEV
ncbi:MAG: thiamine pyrophosphate-binding protein, partial [Isosphaeraceae bacterium]